MFQTYSMPGGIVDLKDYYHCNDVSIGIMKFLPTVYTPEIDNIGGHEVALR